MWKYVQVRRQYDCFQSTGKRVKSENRKVRKDKMAMIETEVALLSVIPQRDIV